MQKRRCGICVNVLFVLLYSALLIVGYPLQFLDTYANDSFDCRIHFIDVGQGDSTFIELSDGKTLLIDAGAEESGEIVCDYITELGYHKIDYVIASHSDTDHIGGFIKIFEKFEVDTIYRPFIASSYKLDGFTDDVYNLYANSESCLKVDSLGYAKFLKAAYNETINGELSTIKISSNNENIVSDDPENPYLVKFFMPKACNKFSTERIEEGYTTSYYEDANDLSSIVEIITEKQKYLFTGDATTKVEKDMLDSLSEFEVEQLSDVSVLHVGHHGSDGSSSQEFLELLSPEYAIISVAKVNEYGLPSKDVLDRCEATDTQVYKTSENGTIILTESGGKISFSFIETDSDNIGWIKIACYIVLGFVVVGIVVLSIVYTKFKKSNNKKELTK